MASSKKGIRRMAYTTQRQPNNFSRVLDFPANTSRQHNSLFTNYNQGRNNKSYYESATVNRIEYYNITYHGAWGYSTSPPMPPLPPSGFLPSMAHYINEPYNMYNPSVPPPQIYHPPYYYDKKLYWRIVNQINYYFSDENLFKDTFLKRNMDQHGWVWITLIASFPRIQQLTNDINFILFALKGSSVIEVWGYKIRRKTMYICN